MKKIVTFLILFFIFIVGSIVNFEVDSKFNNNQGKKIAVIVVGRYAGTIENALPKNFQQYYTWYLNSAGMTYSMLKDTYGYTDENIFLLLSLRDHYEIPDSFNPDWIDYESTKHNLEYVLSRFNSDGDICLKNNDSFVFTFIDHGIFENKTINGEYANNTFFGFPYEFSSMKELISYFIFKQNQDAYKLYDFELAKYIENIDAGKMVFFLQPCYSGGYIDDLSSLNRIILTASRDNETAVESWITPLLLGLKGEADEDGDGKISILDAYEYAGRKVYEKTRDEHPLLDDNADGIGHHYTEIEYNPTNPNSDGYLAGRTYL